MTDAYFHYTPSQIMLAALSLVDHGLVERLMDETFRRASSGEGADASPTTNGDAGGGGKDKDQRKSQIAEEKARAVSAQVRDRVMKAIEACREMLSKEPPERRAYWHEVPDPTITYSSNLFLLRAVAFPPYVSCHYPTRFADG